MLAKKLMCGLMAAAMMLAQNQPALPTPEPAYVLQPGDEIDLKAFNNAELQNTVRIRPDGRISLLLLDDVQAAGRTAEDLSKDLSERYTKHFRNPRITVIVKSFTNRQVFVGGEVLNPRMLPLAGRLTIASAVFSAGGFKSTAKLKEVVLIRDSGQGSAVVSRVDVDRILKSGGSDVELKPFDVVFVPRSRIAKLNLFVEQNVRNMLPLNLGLGFSYLLGQQPLLQ